MLSVDDSSVALVEELEALESFSVSAGFLEALEPVVSDDMLDESKVDSIALVELGI